jgi:hypothetical protein
VKFAGNEHYDVVVQKLDKLPIRSRFVERPTGKTAHNPAKFNFPGGLPVIHPFADTSTKEEDIALHPFWQT